MELQKKSLCSNINQIFKFDQSRNDNNFQEKQGDCFELEFETNKENLR